MHLRSRSGIVESGGLLLRLHALVSVKNWVHLLACSVWAMRCTSLLWCAIVRPFMRGFSHVDRICGHVSLSLLWHGVQLGYWYVRGQNIFFLWFSMYWAYLNHRVWEFWVYVILSTLQRWVESLWSIWLFDNHLSTYGNSFFG